MIICKTPLRISFFGGGTDFEEYHNKYDGKVIGTTIDKYTYASIRTLPPFFSHRHRIVWSKIENVKKLSEIKHPTIKALLKYFKIKNGLEIHYDGDLPGNSGLGSSSSFCTGLINCITKYLGKKINLRELSNLTYHIEKKIMKENIGRQDQIWASYGGFNEIEFKKNFVKVKKIKISKKILQKIRKHLVLVFTGKSRFSDNIEKDKILNIKSKLNIYEKIKNQVDYGKKIFNNEGSFSDLGLMLDEYWHYKKQLSSLVSNKFLDDFYLKAKKSGATGGKILGSGGGGFFLFYVEDFDKFRSQMKNIQIIDFKIENAGSKIIFDNRKNFIK